MSVEKLSKIVASLFVLLVLLSTLLFLQTRNYIPPVASLLHLPQKGSKKPEIAKISSLDALYQLQSNSTLKLNLPLDRQSIERTRHALQKQLDTVLDVQKKGAHIVKYILQVPEDGKAYFRIDADAGRLSGAFKTFRHQKSDGTVVVKLVPINPAWLKG